MIARVSHKTVVTLALFAASACKEPPTRTHIVLDVHVASAIADQVTRIVVHDLRSDASMANAPEASDDFERGEATRFLLLPGSDDSELRIRIVALHERDEITSATLTSHYSAGRGLFLDVELGCTVAHDLGEVKAAATPRKAIDSCASGKQPTGGSGDGGSNSGSGGSDAGSSGQAGESVAGTSASTGPTMPNTAGGGAGGKGAAGRDAAGTGAAGVATAGSAGIAGSGGITAQGFTSGAGGASGTSAADSGGMGGTSGAGTGGAGAGGAGMGGGGAGGVAGSTAGAAGCFTWVSIPPLTGGAEIEALDPGAYRVGFEMRESSLVPMVPQYICQAAPSGMTTKLIGKASKWGCYIPGPGTTAYATTQNVEILNSRNDAPCLAWKPLIASEAPTSTIRFGSGAGGTTQVCYVEHTGTAEGNATSGPRVGQVRLESNQYVCRYEFYSSENRNMTLVNSPSEVARVLDYAP